MANCCSHTPCQELVTVEYLKSFLQLSPCITINDGQGYDACCGTYGGDNYVVTKAFRMPTRNVVDGNPSQDTDGFEIIGIVSSSTCCGDHLEGNSCIPKSGLTFGRTVLTASTLNASISYDEPCNPTYSVTKTDTYVREKYECNGTDGTHVKVEEVNTSVTSSVKSDESFTKNVAVDENENKFNISFTANEITSSTQHCGVTLTASTTPTANGYTIEVRPQSPIEIPCIGEDNVHFATIDGACSSDVEIDGSSGVTSATIDKENKVMVNFGHSEGYSKTNVKVSFKLNTAILTIEQEYTRSSCGFTPTITPDNTCGVFWYNESWDNAQNVVYHPYQTT